jgi:phosphatidylserine/phosphatidylglycerophosphate/cardiolipin synthase-like enzyme
MFQWIKANHAPVAKKRHYDEYLDAAPFPLVSGGWREENAMVNMILHAKRSIHLENQIMISGGTLQHNRICDAIIARICQAHKWNLPFHAIILTNAAQQDEPSQVTRLYCSLSIQWSLEQLENRALDNGLSLDVLRKYLIVGRMQYHDVLVKVHSNILIVDGAYALRSSSNLADRSLSSRPTDTELGVLFAGESVQRLQQELFNMYFGSSGVHYAMADVFELVESGHGGCIVRLEKRAWSPVLTWFLMNVFIYGSEGATGGRHKVSYETSVVSLRHTAAAAVAC